MALIDSSYFVGEISLPVGKYSDLPLFIERLERDFLYKALGVRLANLVIEGDELTDGLVNGITFEKNGQLYVWDGFKNDIKQSIIANYVYYFYLRSNVTITTSTGESRPETENSTGATPAFKVMRAWDEMLRGLATMSAYIATVPELAAIYKPTPFGRVNAFDL